MVTTTGDLPGNVEKLKSELTKIKFPVRSLHETQILQGDPSALLPVLHYTLLNFSKPLAKLVVESGYELNGKTDLRFLETVWKLLREMLDYKPALSINQFLSQGFAERKVLLLCDLISKCKHRHNELLREAGKPAVAKRRSRTSGVTSGHIWASPGERDVPSIVHRSSPLSAARIKKKQMRRTPQHLKAPRGQVEVVSGSTIPVQVVRGQPDLVQTVKYSSEPDAGHPLMAPAQLQEPEDEPRVALPVFWTPAGEQPFPSAPELPREDIACQPQDGMEQPAARAVTAESDEIDVVAVQGAPATAIEPTSGGEIVAKTTPGLETLVSDLADQLHKTTRRLLEISETSERREQTLQARITILEGRVRFLEGAVEENTRQISEPCTTEAAPALKAAAPRVTATGRLAQRKTSPSPKRIGTQPKLPACSTKAVTGRVPAAPVVTTPKPWEEAGGEVVPSAVPGFDFTERSSFQEETIAAVPVMLTNGQPANLTARSSIAPRNLDGAVTTGEVELVDTLPIAASFQSVEAGQDAETAAFISSIAGRFEAARALLDSL